MKRKIKYWCIPQGWLDLKRNISFKKNKSIKKTKSNSSVDDLIQFKNIHKGERCFILASGPSINKQDLSILADEYCISVSQFFLHTQIQEIKPKYHCFAPQHYPFDDATNKIIFDNYVKYCTFSNKCFIGTTSFKYSYKNFLQKNTQYNINAFFIDYDNSIEINEWNYLNPNIWDITKQPFGIKTVIYEAIQIAYYMGFSEIYLLGVDHDYLKDITNTSNHHFYDDSKSFSDKDHLSMISKEDWFLIYHIRWKQYRLMQDYLGQNGTKIYNATPGSMLDVFPYVELDSIMKS